MRRRSFIRSTARAIFGTLAAVYAPALSHAVDWKDAQWCDFRDSTEEILSAMIVAGPYILCAANAEDDDIRGETGE